MGGGISFPEVLTRDVALDLFPTLDPTAFDALAGSRGTITRAQAHTFANSQLVNSAFVFVKPQANTETTVKFVRDKLNAAGCKVLEEGSISGAEIDEKKLIDQHYYAIASKATILKPSQLTIPGVKFEAFFNETWASVLESDRAVNALDACTRFNIKPNELEQAWRDAEGLKKVVKFGGGFYCGLLTVEGVSLYVFNAFFMAMRSKFVGPEANIHYFSIEWSPASMSWSDFRNTLLGPTDPSKAPEDSIRGTILKNWKSYGLAAEPNTADNGVHASASPLEGLAEKINWIGKSISDESFGAALLRCGVSEDTIKAWSVDPRVDMEGGNKSVFDALEDMNASECLTKCIAINEYGSASTPTSTPTTMKAWLAYSANEDATTSVSEMKLVEIPIPTPKANQILVKNMACSINPIDFKLLSNGYQGMFPCEFPYTVGFDCTGVVVAVGEGVTKFVVGDEITVDTGLAESCGPNKDVSPGGAFAEYFVSPAMLAAKKPSSVSFVQAAGLPLAGMTALQALVDADKGDFQVGQKLLVLGGSAATGTYALQLAKNCLGASEVWTTASSNKTSTGISKIEYCTSLGARVIDYATADWHDVLENKDFDVIFDCVGIPDDVVKAGKVLKKGGRFVSIANFNDTSTDDYSFTGFIVASKASDLEKLLTWVEEGKLTIPIDSVIGINDVKDGLLKSCKMSDVSGKIIIEF